MNWVDRYPRGKVQFEVHSTNSLNNRFKRILPITTEAVLSIDDDLIIPCNSLESTFQVWLSNKRYDVCDGHVYI